MISIKSPTIEEILSLKQKVYTLNKDGQEKFLFIFDTIEAVDTGFTYGRMDHIPQTRGRLGCNLATGAVGACAGFLASCIAGPVAGVVVSTVSSAYLSSKAC